MGGKLKYLAIEVNFSIYKIAYENQDVVLTFTADKSKPNDKNFDRIVELKGHPW